MYNSQRQRSERAIANDEAILDAAVGATLRVGVDSMSLRDVGKSAGLTHGATYARYEDVHELLVDMWQSRLCGRAIEILEASIRAVAMPNDTTVGEIIDLIRRPEPRDVAMVEMLLTSRRIPVLQEEVEPFVNMYLELPPGTPAESESEFVRIRSLFAFTMVSIFEEYYFDADDEYLRFLKETLINTLQIDLGDISGQTRSLDVKRAVFVPDDDLRSQLTYSTAMVIGKSGYYGATISRIARRVGCSPGAIYKLYKSKEELVLDAFRCIVGTQWIHDSDFAHILDAETIASLLSGEASNENALRRNFTLETVLAAAHNQVLQPTVSGQLKDPGGVVARLGVSGVEKEWLGHMTHTIASASKGVRWLATMTDSAKNLDFSEFAESLRLALAREWSKVQSAALEDGTSGQSLSPS